MSRSEVHSHFAAAPDSVAGARRFVRDVCSQWGLDGICDTATLLTSELASNAIIHAASAFRVVVEETSDGMRVAIHDRSRALPVVKRFENDAAVGRGLRLVEQLSAEWGVDPGVRSGERKAVWFRLGAEDSGTDEPLAPMVDLDAWPDLEDTAPRHRDDEELFDVRLVDLPLEVYQRAQQHSDELGRELRLVAGAADNDSVPRRLRRLIYELAARYGTLNPAAERHLQRAVQRGDERTDVVYRVPARTAEDVQALDELLREADEYCRTGGGLLTLTTPPEALAFREWVFGEIIRQVGGAAPRPWPTP